MSEFVCEEQKLNSSMKIKKSCPLCEPGNISILCPACKGKGFVMDYNPSLKKKIRNINSQHRATRARKSFTLYDKKIIADFTISVGKAARLLHRSIKSIESARSRLKKERQNG